MPPTGGINPETNTYATIRILDQNGAKTVDCGGTGKIPPCEVTNV
jgi:hypothetical protein